jgi:hypothetical protein
VTLLPLPPRLPRTPRVRRAVAALALCTGLAAGLTSCGEDPDKGTNGVGKLSAQEIEDRARTAADGATAVRVAGTLVSKTGSYRLNMRLKEGGGTGSVSFGKDTFELLRTGEELYIKADAAFWTHQEQGAGKEPSDSDIEAAEKLDGKYVKVPQGDSAYEQFRGFTDMDGLLDGLLGLEGELSKGGRTEIGGVRVIAVRAAEGAGGTLDVSLEGEPYPVQFSRAGGAGVLTLGEWGTDFPLEAPPEESTVDHGRLLPKSSAG